MNVEQKDLADVAEVLKCLSEIIRGEGYDEVIVTENTGEGYSEARAVEIAAGTAQRVCGGQTFTGLLCKGSAFPWRDQRAVADTADMWEKLFPRFMKA